MRFFIIPFLLLTGCTIEPVNMHNMFVNNINGPYQLLHDVYSRMNVDPTGNIVINGLTVYNILLVKSTNSAVYQVTGLDKFIPVSYQYNTLYIGKTNSTISNVDFNNLQAFAVKI